MERFVPWVEKSSFNSMGAPPEAVSRPLRIGSSDALAYVKYSKRGKWSSDRRGINARTVLYFGCGDRF